MTASGIACSETLSCSSLVTESQLWHRVAEQEIRINPCF